MPEGLRRALRSFYVAAEAMAAQDPSIVIYFITAGVIQGCPLSGSIFALSIDSLIGCLSSQLLEAPAHFPARPRDFAQQYVIPGSPSRVWACADDIGMVLCDRSVLVRCFETFECFRALSSLILKPQKSVVILLAAWSEADVAAMQTFLDAEVPAWTHFKICSHATYLGWVLGPTAKATQWSEAIAKFRHRAAALANSGAASSISARLYAERVTSVLSYLPQFGPPPRDLAKLELATLHRVVHWPNNAGSLATFVHFFRFGAPRFRSVTAMAHAAATRFALNNEGAILSARSWPAEAALNCLDARRILHVGLCPNGWDSPCSAEFLMRRVHGPLHLWRSLMGAQPRRPPQISQREAELDRVILAGAAHWRTLARPQKAIHESLEKLWIANDILAKLRQKTATWREPISEELARELLKDVKSLRHPRVIWSVLRTLWKPWPTSHICQEEEIKSCVFGCQAEDRFRHYAGCHRALPSRASRASPRPWPLPGAQRQSDCTLCCRLPWQALSSVRQGGMTETTLGRLRALATSAPSRPRRRTTSVARPSHAPARDSHERATDVLTSRARLFSRLYAA